MWTMAEAMHQIALILTWEHGHRTGKWLLRARVEIEWALIIWDREKDPTSIAIKRKRPKGERPHAPNYLPPLPQLTPWERVVRERVQLRAIRRRAARRPE